jgi:hypothetical protein
MITLPITQEGKMNQAGKAKWVLYAAFAAMCVPAALVAQANNVTVCMDGTMSTTTGSGACASNGGIDQTKTAALNAKVATSKPTTAQSSTNKTWDDNNPNGAQAKCKDGTYWHSVSAANRTGTCSGRGGVDTWLQKPDTQNQNRAGPPS